MKKKIACLAVLGLSIAFAAWMLWPRSFSSDFGSNDALSAFVMTLGIEQVWDEGVPSSQPNNHIESYHDIAADSDTAASIREILNGCTYHLCLDSLTGKQSLSDIGSLQVNLYTQGGWEFKAFNGTAKCFLNNRIVKISGGRKSAEKLCEELAAALRAS
nr:hypothetical protein [uncultured Oscillibacter sp.]